MNLARLSFAELRARAVNTSLNLVLLALGIATIVVILLVSRQLEDRLRRDAAGIDLVIGAKGSSTQLVLSAIFEVDVPNGNVPIADAERIGLDLAVRTAIPLAHADNYWGYRLVGTTHAYVSHYNGVLANGRLWQAPYEAVLGSDVASRMHLTVGSTFSSTHGVRAARGRAHDNVPYKVVGVLARTGTVLDRLILTDVASIQRAHTVDDTPDTGELVAEPPVEDYSAITAVLVQCTSSEAAARLANTINSQSALQAAEPQKEIERLFGFIGIGREILWGFAIVLMLTAGVSSFIALYDALTEHRQELAIMRVLGAGPRKLMALLLIQGILLAAAGAVLGLLLGHGMTAVLGIVLRQTHQLSVTGWTWYPAELWIIALALVVGLAAALLPAWRARGLDIAATLARN